MTCSSCPQNVHWINDSNKWFLPAFLPSFIFPSLPFPPIYLSILPSFLPLRPSLFFHHPTSTQFLLPFLPRACKVQSIKRFLDKDLKNFSVCPLETYQDIFYFQALKKNQLWPQVPTKRKKFTKKIHGYCLHYQWILNKALLFPPRIESSTLLFSRAISTILSWGYQKRMFTFL